MSDRPQAIRLHLAAGLIVLVLWISTWLVTVLTWVRDPDGFSIGMSVAAIPFHFLLPLLVGVVVALSWTGSKTLQTASALAGLVFGLVHFAVLGLVDVVWLPEVRTPLTPRELVMEAIGFAFTYAAICVGLSIVGGRITRTLKPPPSVASGQPS